MAFSRSYSIQTEGSPDRRGDIGAHLATQASASLSGVSETTDVASDLASTCTALAVDWADNATDLDLPYVALGHLAGRLIAVDRAHPGTDFTPFFQEVERQIASGDSTIRNLMIVGLLEGIQTAAPNDGERWEPLLGPSTREAWSALNDAWLGRMAPAEFNKLVDG